VRPCTIPFHALNIFALLVFTIEFLCRSNEHSHVKTNMVYILHRVKGVGCQPLESLKDMLTEEEFRKCATSPHIQKTWYKMTSDVFVAFSLLDNLLTFTFFSFNSSLSRFMSCIYTNVNPNLPLLARDSRGL
jgi:hypothetical protein